MSTKNKRINKKTATKVPVNSSSSPFSHFPRIVGPDGVTTPTPASALTIPQVFQEQQQQQALMAHTADWHSETRHKIIAAIATLPGSPSAQILTGLTSIKLAAHALTLFTAQNPRGNFDIDGQVVDLEQLLLELHLSAPSKHQSDAIHRSINNKLEWIESEWLEQAVTEQKEDLLPLVSVDPSLAPGIGLPQSSIAPQSSLKRSREAVPLELVPVKEPCITQFNLSTQSVPANRLPHQRQVRGTNFFGDLIQANSVQQLATSSLVGLSQSRPRACLPGLATSTRPGRSGEDTRPGMTSGLQRTDFIVVPVPHKSSTVSSLPQQQSQPVAASVLPRDRVVPSLTDNDIPFDPPTTSPNNGDPDLPDSIVDDSLGLTDDSVGLASDLDELPSTDEAPPDVAVINTALTIPRDPLDPCPVTFGPVHDLHETHQGASTRTFEQCFTFPLGSETVHYPPGYDDGASLHGPIIHDPLSNIPAGSTSSLPTSPLQAHPDDDMILSNADRLEHQYFECAFLCTHWNYFHKCTSLLDIKTCLDKMDARSHHLLLVFHVAYFPSQVNLELSFGQTKQNFYQLAHQGHFQYETFDIPPQHVPLASVTVEFFLIRPIPQWRAYLAWHGVELDMTVPQLSDFHEIGPNVQPRLDFGVFILCKIVNFLSSAHRSDTCLTFLRNQLLFSPTFTTDHFRITPSDANLLLQHVFPNEQYPVAQLTNNTGYLLLLRAFKWVHQPHSLASLQKHASEPWIQLFDFVLTRPSLAPTDLVDTSTDACATLL